MPRSSRKRSLLNPQKSQLLFVEQPRNGPRHDYGPQLRSAINPRSFVSEQPRPAIAVSSWVSPQFEVLDATAVIKGGKGRKKNLLSTNTASLMTLPAIKKATFCKYPALSFEASVSVPQRCHKTLPKQRTASCSPEIRPTQGDHAKTFFSDRQVKVPVKTSVRTPSFSRWGENLGASGATVTPFGSSEVLKTPVSFTVGKPRTSGIVHTPASKESYTSLNPHQVETPEMPHGECSPSSPIVHLLFSINPPETPPRSQDLGILVKDTPERDYGIKVTWRRRKTLMKLLRDRGQLLVSEAVISNQWSLIEKK
ncbi:RAD9, HUS1, RAD1-interacting nuclear orphan protein 1 [Electrophorus electricus]|uniref:Uncharacterized protein n=1 Tax=Electrophorus electricus TaxID=8005 RepID=A0AAY5F2A5_ELEEL|nr:RAD9, HUS1, RAD1-interacting nuclear orphan protein 1 [Electrophorus electricus]XP_026866925.2 RAD9, HUS1, RAD1-interacting nuclear orphan protein 1 [Electrophorus electricus]